MSSKEDGMKCDHCDKSATVRETTVKNGAKIERNLCEACAIQTGVLPDAPGNAADILQASGVYISGAGQARASACATCGTTLAEFKQHGLLGCRECYKVFESHLGPLLERAHEGGVVHRGKSPATGPAGATDSAPSGPSSASPAQVRSPARVRKPGTSDADIAKINLLLDQLNDKLKEAIVAENYEQAAKIRDQVVKIRATLLPAAKAARRKPKPDDGAAP